MHVLFMCEYHAVLIMMNFIIILTPGGTISILLGDHFFLAILPDCLLDELCTRLPSS